MADWAQMVWNRDEKIEALTTEVKHLRASLACLEQDCPGGTRDDRHCLHFQEGDGSCCVCSKPNPFVEL